MDTCYFDTVVAVYRYRSFAEAANDRMLSPSTVSKHVASVEKELGVKLFNRATKSSFVTLTDAGVQLREDIESYAAEYTGLLRKAQLIGAGEEERLTLGVLSVAGSLGEDRIISAFYKSNPKVKLTLIPALGGARLLRLLSTGRADGVFCMGYVAEDRVRLTVDGEALDPEKYGSILTFRSDRMYCGVSVRHPLANRAELSLEDLRDELFLENVNLEHSSADSPSVRFLREKLTGYHHRYVDYTLKSVLYDFVAAGNGVILTTTYTGEEHRGCRFIPLRDWSGVTQGWFVYRKDLRSGALRAFRRCVAENGTDMTKAPE